MTINNAEPNHSINRGTIRTEKIILEMEVNYIKELSSKPRLSASDIRKNVVNKYKFMYEN